MRRRLPFRAASLRRSRFRPHSGPDDPHPRALLLRRRSRRRDRRDARRDDRRAAGRTRVLVASMSGADAHTWSRWTPEADDALRRGVAELRGDLSGRAARAAWAILASRTGHTVSATRGRASQLGLLHGRHPVALDVAPVIEPPTGCPDIGRAAEAMRAFLRMPLARFAR